MFLRKLEDLFFNDVSTDRVKLLWNALAGKARQWVQVTLSPIPRTTITELKEGVLTAFPSGEFKWVLEKELCDQLKDQQENGFDSALRKLELIQKLNLTFTEGAKVDLILLPILPKFQENCMANKPATIR